MKKLVYVSDNNIALCTSEAIVLEEIRLLVKNNPTPKRKILWEDLYHWGYKNYGPQKSIWSGSKAKEVVDGYHWLEIMRRLEDFDKIRFKDSWFY